MREDVATVKFSKKTFVNNNPINYYGIFKLNNPEFTKNHLVPSHPWSLNYSAFILGRGKIAIVPKCCFTWSILLEPISNDCDDRWRLRRPGFLLMDELRSPPLSAKSEEDISSRVLPYIQFSVILTKAFKVLNIDTCSPQSFWQKTFTVINIVKWR